MLRRIGLARRIDLRALPISIKITLGLLVALIIGGVITDLIMRQVVRDTQADLLQRDLQAFSRSQALRMVDLLNEETGALSRLGTLTIVRERLLAREQADLNQPQPTGSMLYRPDTQMTGQIVDFKTQHAEFDIVLAVDSNGNILAADPTTRQVETATAATWPWYTEAFNKRLGATFIAGPMDDQVSNLRGIHMAVPVYSPSTPGVAIGVLYAVWNLNNAETLISLGGGRQGIILANDGTVILSPSQALGTAVDPGLLAQIAAHSGDDRFAYTDSSGQSALYGYSNVAKLRLGDTAATRLEWTTIIREPATALDANSAVLTDRLRLLLAAVAAVAGIVVLLYSRILFSPLRRLAEVASEIEQGNLDQPIPQFPQDEIGRLASILDHVVTQLLRRVRQLRNAVQISRVTALGQTTGQMLGDVARALGQQFDYPDVRIFLIDSSGQRVRLEAAFGAESERLYKIGHRISLDEDTLVGRSILLNEPMIGGGKPILRQAGLTTEHTELVVPMGTAGHMLGAIHILAGRLRELDQEDIEILTLVADQLSIAIEGARLLEQTQAQVSEIEALNRRLTRQAWEEYVGESGALRHTLDPDQHWPETMGEVRQRTEIKAEASTDADGRSVLAAPLILRGEAVGTLAITRPPGEKWSHDEILLLESIASRMAMIAEGIRLVEESSHRAEREQRVNEISANLLQRATSVETVLRSALGELGGALGSDRISLRIGSAPARSDRQIGAGTPADEGQAQGPIASSHEVAEPGSNGDGGLKNDE